MTVLLQDIDGPVATLTVNRPEALNALNSEVLDAFTTALANMPAEVRGIIVTGAGDKAFVAGADIAEMKDYGPADAEAFARRGHAAFMALRSFPGPVVAAVQGFALGGGLELALACDILVAGENAKLGLPETTLGVVPGFGGTQTLPRRVGPGRAKELLATGRIVGAEEAFRIGLADQVVANEDVLATARGIVEAAGRNGPLAVAETKRLVNEGAALPLMEALDLEAKAFGAIFGTADQHEGMSAFFEKRRPGFRGA